MTGKLVRAPIADGVFLSALRDKKFKHNRLSVNLIAPLAEETVSDWALLPFLLRKGCRGCPDFTELNRRLDELYGATLLAEVGKLGANQVVELSILSVDDRLTMGGDPLLRQCAELLRDLVLRPLIADGAFPEAEVELERQNLIDTIEAEINDKRGYAVSRCRQIMGRGDPAALRKYGTVEGARRVTPQSVARGYERLLKTAAVEVMFVGPGGASAAEEIFGAAFAEVERAPRPFASNVIVPRAGEAREQTERFDVAQSKLAMGFRTGERGGAARQAAQRLMVSLYGGTPSSKLFVNVRERLSLCYYCAARFDRAAGIMMVDSGVEQQNIEAARAEILRQLDDLKNNIFEDETLENTRLMIKNALRAVGDSSSTLEDWYLNRIVTGEIRTPDEELALVDAVTRDQVVEAARAVSLDTVYLLTAKEGQ